MKILLFAVQNGPEDDRIVYILGVIFIVAMFLAWFGAFIVWPLWALVEAIRTDRAVWDSIHRDKTGWILAILFGSVIGAGIYWRKVRPQLERAKKQHSQPGQHDEAG